MSRQVQKIFRHGHCSAVSISRPMLFALNWVPGQAVIAELLEDCSGVLFRLPRVDDFGPVRPPRLDRRPIPQPQQPDLDLAAPRKE